MGRGQFSATGLMRGKWKQVREWGRKQRPRASGGQVDSDNEQVWISGMWQEGVTGTQMPCV